MTFELLNEQYGPLEKSEWSQHKNGGGWKHSKAVISDDVFLGEKAVVFSGTIWGGTIWGGTIEGGTIWGGTIWGGTIWGGTIKGGTIWGGTIWGGTIWGGTIEGGTIKGGTIWGGTIEGGTWENHPLFLMDSRGHGVTNSKPGHLRIGCECHEFKDWKKRWNAIARKHSLTKVEEVEYKSYVALFTKLGK